MSRYPTAHFGNTQQFGFTNRIFTFSSHLFSQVSMTLCKQDSSITGDSHTLQLFLLVGSFRIIQEIQFSQLPFDTSLYIQQTGLIHLAVHGCMTRCTLFHELGKQTSLVSCTPFMGHVAKDTFTLCTAFPVGNDFTFVGVDILLADGITLQFACIQYMQVFNAMAGQFRESRHSLRLRATFTYD